MKKHVIKICQTAYFELKRISSIRRFLTEDATKTLVTSYILSQLDYCNCLLMGTPNYIIQPLQKIQNFAARLVLLAPHHHHSVPLLENCTGFPLQNVLSINSLVCFSAINGSGPAYLSELLHVYTPSHTLCFSSDTLMLNNPTIQTQDSQLILVPNFCYSRMCVRARARARVCVCVCVCGPAVFVFSV